ncbi:ArsR/SmtB family transcription factor [Kribbella swartbergensis]
MGFRIHFGCADLARTTIAREPDPLWEVLLGMHMLQTDDEPAVFGAWRQRSRARLTALERELLVLAPPVGYSPDFLTPAEAVDGLEAGLAAVAATPPTRLESELRRLSDEVRLPRWTRRLAAGDPAVLKKVCHGLRHFHRTKIAPQLPSMATTIARDVKLHSEAVTTGGFETLAATLHPAMQWRPPMLYVDMQHIDRDLELRGRGLRLVPSFFCWRHPIMPADSDLPPVLVYPVNHDPGWSEPAEHHPDPDRAVADLLGRTRAAVLRTISAGACSTSELAARAGISLASASEHARVLQRTGLVTTHRVGPAVRHTISPIGSHLLTGTPV